jgi:thioesterase domain-containing protein
MIYIINARRKVRLGVAELFRNPTVEQLAALIDQQRPEARRRPAVIQLQEGSAHPPVYFIYAGPAEIRLAQSIGEGRAIFGIEVPWPMAWRRAVSGNRTSLLPDMDQIVAPFVRELVNHVGSSSCVIAGYSFAALIAFETARQLHGQGGKVESVIIVDRWPRYPAPLQVVWENLQQCWRRSLSEPKQGFIRAIGHRLRRSALIIWWLFRLTVLQIRALLIPSLGELTAFLDEEGVPLRWRLVERLYAQIEQNYRPRPLDCHGIIFRTEFMDRHHAVRVFDDCLGWDGLFIRGLDTFVASGDHFSMVREHNRSLGLAMRKVLGARAEPKNEASVDSHE